MQQKLKYSHSRMMAVVEKELLELKQNFPSKNAIEHTLLNVCKKLPLEKMLNEQLKE